MTIRTKLMSTIMLLIFISFVVGGLGVYGIFSISKFMKTIVEEEIPQTWLADSLSSELSRLRKHEKEFFLYSSLGDLQRRNEYRNRVSDNFSNIDKILKNFKISFGETSADLAERIDHLEVTLNASREAFKPMEDALSRGRAFDEIRESFDTYRTHITEVENDAAALKEDILLSIEDVSSSAFTVQQNLFRILPIVSGSVIFIGLVVGFLVSRRITGSLGALMRGIRAVGEGKVDTDVKVRAGDELGQIASVFNETINRLRAYIQTDAERRSTQENLMKFLDILGTASDGDFSEKAPVTADVFGSLADAYNLMIDGVTDLLVDVRRASDMVGSNSRNLIDIFDRMGQGSEVQMVEVKKSSEAVDESSNATMNISDKAGAAQQITSKAAEAAKKGGKLVIQTIEGMQLIRVTVSAINKRMKSLSEKMLEIGSISQLIGDIASRTNMLAMNASIEAARAGEQGKGFVVIAEEIRSLADRSAKATKDITGIIKAIQTEAGEVTSSLEEETNHVENQTKISTDTGLAFRDIDSSIKDSNRIVEEIFGLSQTQRDLTQKVVLAMEEVNRISLQMLKYIDDSKKLTDSLSTTSMTLLNNVSRFKLAEERTPEIGNQEEVGEIEL
ncbi:MAG: HAMP domain-containing protein [Nitrospirota bacterium]|nr:MAG: HAMP domain-containing protein [Nitrospirota bacterium]